MECEGYYSLMAQTGNLRSPESNAAVETKKKKKGSKKGKRFSDEQIKLLESIFKVENKLETKKKLEIARELGLQPRQVAIWFQNRRARWKSKQIEEEYEQLKASFDNLSLQFESLKKEKESLIIQFERLSSLVSSPQDSQRGIKDSEENGDRNHIINDLKEEGPSSLNEGLNHHESMYIGDNEEEEEEEGGLINSINEHKEESGSFKFDEYGGGDNSVASAPEEWCNDVDIGGLFSHPSAVTTTTTSCKWWEF